MRKMKKASTIFMVLALIASLLLVVSVIGCAKKEKKADQVTLVLTSWRTEDIEGMARINALYEKTHPNVKINFQPINDTEYDANARAGLETGTGADIIFLRSYDTGRAYWDDGFLYDLTNVIPNLANFPQAAKDAWSTPNGITYGVPSVGVTHGIFYQKSIFAKYGLKEPKTWAEFIALCDTLLANGETIFAQGALDDWTLYEVVFSGLGPNFYGGEKARQDLMAGKAKLTDANFIKAFEAVYSLKKYFPRGYEALDYVSMQQMFGAGQAAMFFGGSWEITPLEDLGSDSNALGWFPPPVVNAGDTLQYCFHVDAGIGVNKKTKYLDEALDYIKWVSGAEYAQAIMNELPGFFSYTPVGVSVNNSLAQKMFDVVASSETTVRTVWENLSAQAPSGNELMGIALPGMMTDQYTPRQAAELVQSQLETWYKPFQK